VSVAGQVVAGHVDISVTTSRRHDQFSWKL
jgi:hypothetical protein